LWVELSVAVQVIACKDSSLNFCNDLGLCVEWDVKLYLRTQSLMFVIILSGYVVDGFVELWKLMP